MPSPHTPQPQALVTTPALLLTLLFALWAAPTAWPAEPEEVEEPALTEFMKLWDFNDPAATESKFKALLPKVVATGDVGLQVEVLTQLARTQGLQQRSDDAHRTLDQAQALLKEGMVRPRVRVLLERGRATNGIPGATDAKAQERKRNSCAYFVEAWELATQGGEDALAVDAAHMLGIVEEPDAALAWNLKAIRFAEASTDEGARKWLGSLYNNTGWTYFAREAYESALELFEQDVALRAKLEQPVPHRIARWSRAKTLRKLGRPQDALKAQQTLEEEWAAAGAPDGYVFEELGECWLALDRPTEARPWFEKAHGLLSQDAWLVQNEPERISRLQRLGTSEAGN